MEWNTEWHFEKQPFDDGFPLAFANRAAMLPEDIEWNNKKRENTEWSLGIITEFLRIWNETQVSEYIKGSSTNVTQNASKITYLSDCMFVQQCLHPNSKNSFGTQI